MKNLILVRHATAESENFLTKDFERVLNSEGKEEAIKLGNFIKSKDFLPDAWITSSARRTHQTSKIACSVLGFSEDSIVSKIDLYNSGFQKIIAEIKNSENELNSLVLVGHNPGISQAATALAKAGNFQLAPSAAVSLAFDIGNWLELTPATGKENWYYFP